MANYYNGRKHGKFFYYDVNGNLESTKMYVYGREKLEK
ncbi:MAG: hypothetical protein FJ347_02035 [Sphingomonadales bacterium]|nr:hypothetical protein [Sphingomonadales bacterium]